MVKKKVISKTDKLKLNAKDIRDRALWTFVETFIASGGIIFAATNLEDAKVAFLTVLVSSLAATLSAVKTSVLAVRDK